MYKHIHTDIHTNMYTFMYSHTHACTHTDTHTYAEVALIIKGYSESAVPEFLRF